MDDSEPVISYQSGKAFEQSTIEEPQKLEVNMMQPMIVPDEKME